MSALLRNPTVLITSGVKRLGLALTREALDLGFDVIAHYRTSPAPLGRLLRADPALCGRVRLLQADITPGNASEVVASAASQCRRLVGLVNNASLFTPGGPDNSAHLRSTIESNALVPAALTAALSEQVRSGWIVNITDAHVRPFTRTWQNYRLSKLLLTDIMARQALLYAPSFRVNAIAPGAILAPAGMERSTFRSLARLIPLRRTGSVDDVRAAFAYLVRSSYVTGQVLFVDGGWHLSG